MASKLVLGTMNIIGDATNPFEFTPNPADVNDAEYQDAATTGSGAFNTLTVGAAKAMVASSSFLSEKLTAYTTAQGFADDDTVATLCKTKKLDLSLDNKWVDGRLNAIVFALSPMPDNAALLQIDQASNAAESYQAAILAYYDREWPNAAADLADQVASLLLWDFCCAIAANEGKEAFAVMAKGSYLLQADGVTPTPREDLLRTLFAPLNAAVAKHPEALVIVGCQEMPRTAEALQAAIPAGCTLFMSKFGITGFVYSASLEADFADVSEEIRPELTAWLNQNEVDKKVVKTTMEKMVVGTFNLPTGKVAVLVLHCKSFKKLSEKQGLFVAQALRSIADKFDCPAYCTGDMNIEGKWKGGTSAADQAAAVRGAELGLLPPAVVGNSNSFGDAMAVSGYDTYPKAGTITTLKMRTQFQGQPEKDGDLTAVHKDYVILPRGTATKEVIVGGRPADGAYETNIQLLQPSREWPADHFAIFTVL